MLALRSRAIYSSNTQIGDELLICTPEQMKECVEGKDTQPVFPGEATVSEAMFQRAMGKMKGWLAQEEEEPRRAPRSIHPEILVYYWDGSAPEGRRIHDISQSGAYICTPERWYLGTIIRLILQRDPKAMREDGAAAPTASICVPARVVQGTDPTA
jgi:hypothetical protein